MAKRNSTSKAPSRRKNSASRDNVPAGDSESVPRDVLEDAIEDEWSRLRQTQTLLRCVLVAMEFEQEGCMDHPLDYGSVLILARDLVNQSIKGLDPDIIQPLISAVIDRSA